MKYRKGSKIDPYETPISFGQQVQRKSSKSLLMSIFAIEINGEILNNMKYLTLFDSHVFRYNIDQSCKYLWC